MKKIFDLNGDKWMLAAPGGDVNAVVPGCVTTDLLNNGLIEDPFYRDNENSLMWIGEKDWTYYRDFIFNDDVNDFNNINLICKGLDTFAEIKINDKKVSATNNMFREYSFDIKEYIASGANKIEITFKSTFEYINKKLDERYLIITGINQHRLLGGNYVRKMQCNYGWDWGPICVTAGIWRDIYIEAYNDVTIQNVKIDQEHLENNVCLTITTEVADEVLAEYELVTTVGYEGNDIQSVRSKLAGVKSCQEVIIENPQLWWPNNLGNQNMYKINTKILNKKNIVDEKTCRIGLRTLVLDRHCDKWGESFQFEVNGHPFFAKGANWIPKDVFVTRHSATEYRDLLTSAKDANMNFIRVWGGGIYEDDEFYNICDELGLCVWQDFMFACSAYPVYDEEFVDNFKKEAIDNVIRLRNHPCLALWCGNNEIEYMGYMVNDDGSDGAMTWDEYKYLFDDVIPNILAEYDDQRDYWPSSPMSVLNRSTDAADSSKGDAHLWDVWHGRKPFEWYRTCEHRFNSEFGFQSFPEPSVVNKFTKAEDRNITGYVMEHHQRSEIGNDAIIQYMLSWFKLPTKFDMLLWTSQILQSLAIKYAVEHWRRKMPQGMGTLYWQLNDCWPAPSWSSIDYYGNWKALHYSAKRFFAPVLLTGLENRDNLTLELHLSNDMLKPVSGKVKWKITSLDGMDSIEDEFKAKVDANSSKSIKNLDLKSYINKLGGTRNIVVFYEYIVDSKKISQNTSYFERPKHMNFKKPKYNIGINQVNDKEYEIEISADKPCLWVWCQLDGIENTRFSDNFFDLDCNELKIVKMYTDKSLSMEMIMDKININSIVDTYEIINDSHKKYIADDEDMQR